MPEFTRTNSYSLGIIGEGGRYYIGWWMGDLNLSVYIENRIRQNGYKCPYTHAVQIMLSGFGARGKDYMAGFYSPRAAISFLEGVVSEGNIDHIKLHLGRYGWSEFFEED